MAIDLRARVTCNLGPVISGSLGDDYIQGSGLIRTQGSVLINAVISPVVGTRVVFTYTKGDVPRRIPRAVRVLSSFADPIRKTTQIELGCKLTYLSDLTEPIDWTPYDNPEGGSPSPVDPGVVPPPVKAASVMRKCLKELDLQASSVPLENWFSVPSLDLSAGYVQVLSDLLVSEGYYGYLDPEEVLQIGELADEPSDSLLLKQEDLIDLGPIGVGSLPGEAVTVSYNTLKLKQPSTDIDLWDLTTSTANTEAVISWDAGSFAAGGRIRRTVIYKGTLLSGTATFYLTASPATGNREVVRRQQTATLTPIPVLAGSYLSDVATFIKAFVNPPLAYQSAFSLERTTYEYDQNGNEVFRSTSVYKSEGEIISSTGIKLVGLPNAGINDYIRLNFGLVTEGLFEFILTDGSFTGTFPAAREVSRTIVRTSFAGDVSRVITEEFLMPHLTISGQQSFATQSESIVTLSDAQVLVNEVLNGGLVLAKRTVETSRKGINTAQERPSLIEMINTSARDGGDPDNGWRTEGRAELVLVTGSSAAQRRLELSLPYAPDDVLFGSLPRGPFTVLASDARQKALAYGRIQNRLLLGNRNGISIQVAPERVPSAPFSPIAIQAGNYIGSYRTNAVQWAFDGSGLVCSTDALYWGVVGQV